jgi:hypothetical protein
MAVDGLAAQLTAARNETPAGTTIGRVSIDLAL